MSWFNKDLLISGCKELGIELSSNQLKKFHQFGELIQATNAHTNLTRVPPNDFVTRHYLDSLLIVPYLKKKKANLIVDIGTGAGFPGIPLAITLQDSSFLLVDSSLKRIKFLEEVVSKLELNNVKLLHGRAEDKSKERGTFDVAVSRAVAPLEKLIPWMKPWIHSKGIAIAIKGPGVTDEARKITSEVQIEKPSMIPFMGSETYLAFFK